MYVLTHVKALLLISIMHRHRKFYHTLASMIWWTVWTSVEPDTKWEFSFLVSSLQWRTCRMFWCQVGASFLRQRKIKVPTRCPGEQEHLGATTAASVHSTSVRSFSCYCRRTWIYLHLQHLYNELYTLYTEHQNIIQHSYDVYSIMLAYYHDKLLLSIL